LTFRKCATPEPQRQLLQSPSDSLDCAPFVYNCAL
jgi:hypothetical protein